MPRRVAAAAGGVGNGTDRTLTQNVVYSAGTAAPARIVAAGPAPMVVTATVGGVTEDSVQRRMLSTVSIMEDNEPFPIGQVVKVGTRIKFVGTITHAYGDGTYDIVYQDGKLDFDIPHAIVSVHNSSDTDDSRGSRSSSVASLGIDTSIDNIDIEDAVSEEWASIGKVVPAGSKLDVGPLAVKRSGALLEWKFAVVDGDDVEFSVLFADGTHVPEVVVEEQLCVSLGMGRGDRVIARAKQQKTETQRREKRRMPDWWLAPTGACSG
jgi:hypothetical protein